MKVVFFGTSAFAARTLSFLKEKSVEVVAIVTRPDRPRGRHAQLLPPPVKEEALKSFPSTPIFQPEKASTPECAALLSALHPDLFIVVAYGEIIKKNLLDIPNLGAINIHASLLPKYRGAAPMQRALMDGVEETGVTIIEMTPRMDDGPILNMKSTPVAEEMTLGDLESKLCELGSLALWEVLEKLKSGHLEKILQDPNLVTFAPKILAEEEKISWNLPAKVIHNQIRALSPFPGAWCTVSIGKVVKRLKIKKASVVAHLSGRAGANLKFDKEGWVVGCGEGALQLLEVQLEGKKVLSFHEFMRGQSLPVEIA